MIEKMTRYDWILSSGQTDDFLRTLQDLGVVDITRSVKAVDEKSEQLLSEAESLKKQISWLTKGDYAQDAVYAGILADIAAASKEQQERASWGEFDPEKIALLEQNGRRIRFYAVSKKKFDPAWEELYPLQVIGDNGTTLWFVTISDDPEYSLPVPECARPEGTANQSAAKIADLKGALAERERELKAIDIDALAEDYRSKVTQADLHFASLAAEKAVEGTVTVITGFAPTSLDAELKKKFDAMDLYWVSADAILEDNPPIRLKNNKFVSMFEVLTDMYGRPAYNGFDPTPYISIFFLLFFAMCMGDAGYGLLLIVIGLLLKKVRSFSSLAPLVVTLGAGTTVIGFLFHTFFSMDISTWACIPDALKSIMVPAKVATYDGTMVLALIVGIVHLCLAMIVKTIYATKNQGFLGSLGTWGWTLLIVGGVVVAGIALAGVIDATATKIAVIVIGTLSALGIFLLNDLHRNPLLNIGSGLWETYNTATGVLGDVLSYLRLYALGLAGGMLGFAFNDLAKMALGDGGLGWVFFILIVVIGHTLNIAMAALGAFVHPLRLNFLEFFKNSGYEGSGRNYNPLQNKNN